MPAARNQSASNEIGAMSGYFLTSERLGFRAWTAGDLAYAAALWGDPDVARYNGGVRSSRQIEQWLNQELTTSKTTASGCITEYYRKLDNCR
jgi:hypothetical protein